MPVEGNLTKPGVDERAQPTCRIFRLLHNGGHFLKKNAVLSLYFGEAVWLAERAGATFEQLVLLGLIVVLDGTVGDFRHGGERRVQVRLDVGHALVVQLDRAFRPSPLQHFVRRQRLSSKPMRSAAPTS